MPEKHKSLCDTNAQKVKDCFCEKLCLQLDFSASSPRRSTLEMDLIMTVMATGMKRFLMEKMMMETEKLMKTWKW